MAIQPHKKRLRQTIGIPQDRIVILYQGLLDVNRGLTDLIAALPRVSKSACVVLMGYGQSTEEITACADNLGLKDRVFMLPPVPQRELMDFTADADIGTIPLRALRSYRFACPGKLFEFIGAGLPLVVSDLPDLRRFVVSYSLGEAFKSGDSCDLARALSALVDSREYREGCAQRSRALHQQSVCWEVQSGKLCDIILS
jgi:glycosyltransferase involved in cell wall biosynthesis